MRIIVALYEPCLSSDAFFITDSSNVSSVALKFSFFGLQNALQVEFAHLFNNIPFIFSTFIHLVMQS